MIVHTKQKRLVFKRASDCQAPWLSLNIIMMLNLDNIYVLLLQGYEKRDV